jgi:hypothetical protein
MLSGESLGTIFRAQSKRPADREPAVYPAFTIFPASSFCKKTYPNIPPHSNIPLADRVEELYQFWITHPVANDDEEWLLDILIYENGRLVLLDDPVELNEIEYIDSPDWLALVWTIAPKVRCPPLARSPRGSIPTSRHRVCRGKIVHVNLIDRDVI